MLRSFDCVTNQNATVSVSVLIYLPCSFSLLLLFSPVMEGFHHLNETKHPGRTCSIIFSGASVIIYSNQETMSVKKIALSSNSSFTEALF